MSNSLEHKYAVSMVIHNGENYLRAQVASILDQCPPPCCVFVVDDSSSDGSKGVVSKCFEGALTNLIWVEARLYESASLYTRIARNFSAALSAAADHRVIFVADQDDVWMPGRIERQAARIEGGALLTAGSAEIIDSRGEPTGGNVRETFPVPEGWESLTLGARMDHILAQPMVTGAAMALSPQLLERGVPIPSAWLHDRWLSLVAGAMGGLDLRTEPELKYRVHGEQVVGLGRRRARGVGGMSMDLVISAKKMFDLCFRLRKVASNDAIRSRLGVTRVLRSLMSRRR